MIRELKRRLRKSNHGNLVSHDAQEWFIFYDNSDFDHIVPISSKVVVGVEGYHVVVL